MPPHDVSSPVRRGFRRSSVLALLLLTPTLASCSGEDSGSSGDEPSGVLSGADYLVESPSFDLEPGDEKTFCYYTSLPNETRVGVKRWASKMTEGSHHMILFRTDTQTKPNGTLEECGANGLISGSGAGGFPVWTYAAQQPELDQPMPDGVGTTIEAHQPVVIQMHYLNTFGKTLHPSVTLGVETFAPETEYIPASVFVTYNTQIDVPPQSTGFAEGSCDVKPDANFFYVSTHSHRFTTTARIDDGEDQLVFTDDWEHPAVAAFRDGPFFNFASGKLHYRCDYENFTNQSVTVGDSAETDEMCMAVGYFFPAETPTMCINSFVVKQ